MNKKEPILLECHQVSKAYKDVNTQVNVLLDVSLTIKPGEQIAIMGRSGSGKTTLLQILGGLDIPTSGAIWFKGQKLHALNESSLEKIRNRSYGFIYQMHHLLPEFTAIENVAMPLLIGKVAPALATKRAIEILEEVGLSTRLHHRPAELSGGERQRVAIARAFVNQPECVLADEPTGNLDDESALQVFAMIQKINRATGTSLIMVTHDAALAAKMDRTYVLQGGVLTLQN